MTTIGRSTSLRSQQQDASQVAAGPGAPRPNARFKRRGEAGAVARTHLTAAETVGRRSALRRQLKRLDAAWDVERERHMLEGRYGSKYLPTSGRVWGNIAAGLLILYALAYGEPKEGMSDGQVMLYKWLVVGVMVILLMDFHHKASAFGHARKAYERRRAELQAGDLELAEDWEDEIGAEWIVGAAEPEEPADLETTEEDSVPEDDVAARVGARRGWRRGRGTSN